jgi:hypothetical protein
MSSHYFVKEGQEPALLILEPVPYHLAADLLEWVPVVMVDERALEQVLSWGIKVDVVFVSESEKERVLKQLCDHFPVEIIPYPAEGDRAVVFQQYLSGSCSALNVLSLHAEKAITQFAEFQNIILSVIDEATRWMRVASRFEKWVPAHARFRLKKIIPDTTIETNGYEQADGVFVAVKEGIITFSANEPFWLGEKL